MRATLHFPQPFCRAVVNGCMGNRANAGLTLVELIVTLAVAAILLGVGAPSFTQILRDGRLSSEATCLNLALFAARSEAVKRSSDVSVCARAGDVLCGTDWNQGVLVFLDGVPGNDAQPAAIDAGDQVIRRCPPLSDTSRLLALGSDDGTAAGASKRSHIRYRRSGQTNWDNGYFALCDDREADRWKALNVAVTGDVRAARLHTDGDALVNAFNGKITSCD